MGVDSQTCQWGSLLCSLLPNSSLICRLCTNARADARASVCRATAGILMARGAVDYIVDKILCLGLQQQGQQ